MNEPFKSMAESARKCGEGIGAAIGSAIANEFDKLKKELADANEKLAYLKSKGITVGMLKEAGKEPRLSYHIEMNSELCDLKTLRKLCEAEAESMDALGKLREAEAKNIELEKKLELALRARQQGRREALEILLRCSAEEFERHYTRSSPIADTGDYSLGWKIDELEKLFDIDESESLIEQLDAAYWQAVAERIGAEERIAHLKEQLRHKQRF